MRHYLLELVKTRQNILLLQGPPGPFFKNVAQWLSDANCHVHKINFNGGDEFFYRKNSIAYTGGLNQFEFFLVNYIRTHSIDAIVVFGDCRHYHKIAKSIVEKNAALSFWVFEEGYLRPHYITFEKVGVNGFSIMSKQQEFYQNTVLKVIDNTKSKPCFFHMVYYVIVYYLCLLLAHYKYRHYQHHRQQSLMFYFTCWCTAIMRRIFAKVKQRTFIKSIKNDVYKPFYVFPLQCKQDSQIQMHSSYRSMEPYICRVIRSFARNAHPESHLVIKHHPMDDGFHNYRKLIKAMAKRYNLGKRVLYVHDVPMPILLRKAIGLVTINSTCGFSALIHKLPVKTLAKAQYDIPGLTFQGSLDRFWLEGCSPERDLFERYLGYLCSKSQIKGSIYYSNIVFKLN